MESFSNSASSDKDGVSATVMSNAAGRDITKIRTESRMKSSSTKVPSAASYESEMIGVSGMPDPDGRDWREDSDDWDFCRSIW